MIYVLLGILVFLSLWTIIKYYELTDGVRDNTRAIEKLRDAIERSADTGPVPVDDPSVETF